MGRKQQKQQFQEILYGPPEYGDGLPPVRSGAAGAQAPYADYGGAGMGAAPHAPGTGARRKPGGASVALTVVGLVSLLLAAVLIFMVAFGLMTLDGRPFDLFEPAGQDEDLLQPGGTPQLQPTRDAGTAYVEETLFIGDSNFVRLWMFGLAEQDSVLAEAGIGVWDAAYATLAEADGQPLTYAAAARALRPKRILIMLGTNDVGNQGIAEFERGYKALLAVLKSACPQSSIVVAGIPPAAQATSYTKLTPKSIDEYNAAILRVCTESGVPYLDTIEALCGADGYCPAEYTEGDGLHLTAAALEELLGYYRAHAYNP